MSRGQSFSGWTRSMTGPKTGMTGDEAARFSRLRQLRDDVRTGRMTLTEANLEWDKIAAAPHVWKVAPPTL